MIRFIICLYWGLFVFFTKLSDTEEGGARKKDDCGNSAHGIAHTRVDGVNEHFAVSGGAVLAGIFNIAVSACGSGYTLAFFPIVLTVCGSISFLFCTAYTLENVLACRRAGGGGGIEFVIMALCGGRGLFLKNQSADGALAAFGLAALGAGCFNGGNLFGLAVFGHFFAADGALDGMFTVFAGFGLAEGVCFGLGFGVIAAFALAGIGYGMAVVSRGDLCIFNSRKIVAECLVFKGLAFNTLAADRAVIIGITLFGAGGGGAVIPVFLHRGAFIFVEVAAGLAGVLMKIGCIVLEFAGGADGGGADRASGFVAVRAVLFNVLPAVFGNRYGMGCGCFAGGAFDGVGVGFGIVNPFAEFASMGQRVTAGGAGARTGLVCNVKGVGFSGAILFIFSIALIAIALVQVTVFNFTRFGIDLFIGSPCRHFTCFGVSTVAFGAGGGVGLGVFNMGEFAGGAFLGESGIADRTGGGVRAVVVGFETVCIGGAELGENALAVHAVGLMGSRTGYTCKGALDTVFGVGCVADGTGARVGNDGICADCIGSPVVDRAFSIVARKATGAMACMDGGAFNMKPCFHMVIHSADVFVNDSAAFALQNALAAIKAVCGNGQLREFAIRNHGLFATRAEAFVLQAVGNGSPCGNIVGGCFGLGYGAVADGALVCIGDSGCTLRST